MTPHRRVPILRPGPRFKGKFRLHRHSVTNTDTKTEYFRYTCVCVGLSGHTLDKSDKRRRTALNFGNWQLLGCISTLSNTHSNRSPHLKYTYIFFGCFRIGIINQPSSYFHNQKQQISPPPILFTTNRYVHNPILKRKFRASLVPASVSCQSLRITYSINASQVHELYGHLYLYSNIFCICLCSVCILCGAASSACPGSPPWEDSSRC